MIKITSISGPIHSQYLLQLGPFINCKERGWVHLKFGSSLDDTSTSAISAIGSMECQSNVQKVSGHFVDQESLEFTPGDATLLNTLQ